MKGSGSSPGPREVNRFEGGVGWIAYPDEDMQRASQAVVGDDGVWIVDPVDVDGVEEIYGDLGEVAGVVVGLDRHERDAAAVARRHDVPVYVPEWMRSNVSFGGADVETFGDALPDGSFRTIRVKNNAFWKEAAYYDADGGTLVVPEAVGTASYFRGGSEPLGVHPMLRPVPPRRQFRDLSPDRVLVGHGAGVTDDATRALRDALQNARKRMPAAYAKAARQMLPL